MRSSLSPPTPSSNPRKVHSPQQDPPIKHPHIPELPSTLKRRHPLRWRKPALRRTHRLPRPTHRRRREPLEIRRQTPRRWERHRAGHAGHGRAITGWRTGGREGREGRHAATAWWGDEAWGRSAGAAGHEGWWGHACCGGYQRVVVVLTKRKGGAGGEGVYLGTRTGAEESPARPWVEERLVVRAWGSRLLGLRRRRMM